MSSNFGFIGLTFPEPRAHSPGEEDISPGVPLSSILENSRLAAALKHGDVLNAEDRATNNAYWGYEGSGMPANLNYHETSPEDGPEPPAAVNAPDFRIIGNLESALGSDSNFQKLASPYMPNLIPPDIHNPTEAQTLVFIMPEGARSRNSDGNPVDGFREDINGDKTNPAFGSFVNRAFSRPIPPLDRVTTMADHP